MKALLSVAFLFATALALAASGPVTNPGTETIKMRVQSYKTDCGDTQCFLVQKGASIGMDTWETLNVIEGFNYETGYVYDLSVRIERVENGNDPQFRYILVDVISKQAAG